jgi:hypothetical protein
MSRAPSSFRKTDAARLYDVAYKAGVVDPIIEFDVARRCLRIVPAKAAAAKQGSELDQWMSQHADKAEGR